MSASIPENIDPTIVALFPSDDTPVDPQDEFDALERSIDDFPADSDLVVTSQERPPLGKSWKFAFAPTVGFVTNRGQGPLATFGIDTLKGWIDKCLHTARGAHPIHPPNYGVVDPFSLIGKHFDSHEQASYEDRVIEALLFHPRIAAVRDFGTSFDPDDEVLSIEMTVVLDDDTAVPVGVTL